jgi:coupling of ubiquitin conjugation to ER degradation protein 1
MFPDIPLAAIRYDLQKTGSVEVTCEHILRNNGILPMVFINNEILI